MKRRVTAVLASAAALAVTSCSRLTLTDETVATEPAEQETTASVQTGPPKEELETIAPFPDNTEQEMPKEPKGLKLIIATDIHYLASDLTDRGTGFVHSMEHGDGKVTNYIWEITDAFIEEVLNERPDAVILSEV